MKKLLVTGGAGFIGSEFVRICSQLDYQLVVIDKLSYAGDQKRIQNVEHTFYKIDLCDKEAVDKIFLEEKPELVVHFAAESHVDRSIEDSTPFIETNIKGTQNLLDAAKTCDVERFINISTDEVYGDLGPQGFFDEKTSLNPSSPYSVSKASADMLGRAYFRTFNLPVITVRPSNNYGPWQFPEKLLPVIILKAVKGEKIPVYGDGKNVREWLYVRDCATAVLTILKKGKVGEIYNLGSGEEKTNLEVVKYILKLLDKSENLIEFVGDRMGHDFRYSLNSSKITSELNWKREKTFEEGVKETVNWFMENLDWAYDKYES